MLQKIAKVFFILIFIALTQSLSASNTLIKLKKINKILKKYRVFNTTYPQKKEKETGLVFHPFYATTFQKGINKKMLKKSENLVVGYQNPDERVSLSGNQVIWGDIIVVNNGELTFNNANITLYGNILIADNGTLKVSNSILVIASRFIYSNYMMIYQNGKVELDNVNVFLNGFNFICAMLNNSQFRVKDTYFDACITTGVRDNSSATIENSNPYEWVIQDEGRLAIKDSNGPFILWPVFGQGSTVNTSFPEGSHIDNYSIKNGENGFSNISIEISIENSNNVLWGMMVKQGANITIRDSSMTSTAIVSTAQDFFKLNGLVNNQYFSNTILPVNGIHLNFINSSVKIFNFYQNNTHKVKIANSILGEIGVESGSKCEIQNTIIDGSGGFFYTEGETTTTFLSGSLFSHSISSQHSVQVFINSNIKNGDIISKDSSVILFANTTHDRTPQALNNSLVIDMAIDTPTFSLTNQIIPLSGSATVFHGEQSPIRFSNYSIQYKDANTTQWKDIASTLKTPVDYGIIGFWNTHKLEPGIYTLKLTLNLNMGEPIEITRDIMLGADTTGENTLLIPHIDNGEYWKSYIVLDNLSEYYRKAELFLLKSGSFYKKMAIELDPYEQKQVVLEGKSGFIRGDRDLYAREFFVSKTEGGIAEFNLTKNDETKCFFLLPLYAKDNITWEGIAIFNTKQISSRVILKAYSQEGIFEGEKEINLKPLERKAFLLNTIFEGSGIESFSMVEAISDSTPLQGIVISGRENKSLLFTPSITKSNPGKLIIPHIANEWEIWQNFLIIDNLGSGFKTAKLTLFSNGQQVLDREEFTIPPLSQITINLNNYKNLSPQCGFIDVEENCIAREGFVVENGGIAEFLLTPDTAYTLVFNIPSSEGDNLNWNGIALMNTEQSDANIVLETYSNGELTETREITLKANERIAFLLSSLFPQQEVIERVVITSNKKLSGIRISGKNQELLLFSSPLFVER